jgi:hypothetical protein
MWFPYSVPVRWKAQSQREHINESLADEDAREFVVGFSLGNPLTREWQVELQLTEPHWTQAAEQEREISTGYYPNDTGLLAEIICRLHESNATMAVRRCYAHVSRMLSCWSALKGRALAIQAFRIADVKHNARWRVTPFRPSTLNFDLPLCEILPESYLTITALYREARNSTSDIYRFLCCHKILSMWKKGADPFGLLQARVSESGKKLAGDYHVSQEMLALSGLINFRPELEGLNFVDLLEPLAIWRQWALQAVIDERLPDQLGEYEHGRELSSVANLADLAVHRILVDEINGWQNTTADV